MIKRKLFRRKTDVRNSDTKVFGISYDDALALLKKYNEDPFHITHGETVSKLMRYYAKKYDPQNEEFWAICGLLHDFDWEKWNDMMIHTVKAADLLKEAGVNMQVAHVIQTHNEHVPGLGDIRLFSL